MEDFDKGGWGYVVVAGSHLSQVLLMGMAGSLSVVFSEWAYDFNASIGLASMVLGIVPITAGIFSPVAAVLSGRFGCRPVAFVGGGITVAAAIIATFAQSMQHLFFIAAFLAIGIAMAYAPSILVLGEYFKKRIVLANAVSFVGVSTGQLFLPPFLSFLIATYGWRGLFFIFGAIYMHLFVCAAIFRPNRRNSDQHIHRGGNHATPNDSINHHRDRGVTDSHSSRQSSFWAKLAKDFGIPILCINPQFILTFLSITTTAMSYFGANIFLIPRAEDSGFTKEKSALLMSCVGIGGIIGRLGHGIIIDRGYVTAAGFFMIAMVTGSIETFLIPASDNYAFLVCLSFAFGISSGIISPLCLVIPREVASRTNTELVIPAVGLSMLMATAGQSLGALLAAILYTTSGRYSAVFSVLGGLMALTTLIFLPVYISLRRTDTTKGAYPQSAEDEC